MKKFLYAAILFASTTFGFAKDIVQNVKLTDNELSKTENIVGTNLKTFKFDSIEEAQLFLKRCTDVHAFFEEVEVPDGNGGTTTELEWVGTIEISYDCESGGVSLYIWY